MRDIDTMIDEALDQEQREVLARMGQEPGFFAQAFGMFGGSTGWVNALLMVVQALLFVAGAFAAVRFFGAAEVMDQLRWGLPAAVLLLMSVIVKMALLPRMEAIQIIRELKRLELQLALRRE